eukprot:g19886.t1
MFRQCLCAFADFRSTSFHAKAISCAFRPGWSTMCRRTGNLRLEWPLQPTSKAKGPGIAGSTRPWAGADAAGSWLMEQIPDHLKACSFLTAYGKFLQGRCDPNRQLREAFSPNSTPFQSPVSESAFWTPQSSASPTDSVAFPPGFTPGQPYLGPLPRTSSVVSTTSSISLQRTASNGRPYPPGLGWTPQVTPHDDGLQRKLSFGLSLEEPKLRHSPADTMSTAARCTCSTGRQRAPVRSGSLLQAQRVHNLSAGDMPKVEVLRKKLMDFEGLLRLPTLDVAEIRRLDAVLEKEVPSLLSGESLKLPDPVPRSSLASFFSFGAKRRRTEGV